MARESTISLDQVSSAANSLLSQGIKPTARSVREKLGTGSMATILKHFQAWQAAQAPSPAAAMVLSKDLEQVLLNFVGREVASAKGALEADLVSLKQANEDLITENERQTKNLDALQKALDSSIEDKASLAGRLAQMEADLATARRDSVESRQAAEHARTELAKSLLRLEAMPRLELELERLRTELQAQRDGRVASEQAAAVMGAKYDALREAHQRLDAEHGACSTKLLEITAAFGDERLAHQQSVRHLADTTAQLKDATALASQLQDMVKSAQLEAATLNGRLQEKGSAGSSGLDNGKA